MEPVARPFVSVIGKLALDPDEAAAFYRSGLLDGSQVEALCSRWLDEGRYGDELAVIVMEAPRALADSATDFEIALSLLSGNLPSKASAGRSVLLSGLRAFIHGGYDFADLYWFIQEVDDSAARGGLENPAEIDLDDLRHLLHLMIDWEVIYPELPRQSGTYEESLGKLKTDAREEVNRLLALLGSAAAQP